MISKNKSKKRKNVGYYRLIYYCLNGTHFGKPQQIQLWKRPTRSLAVRFWVCRAPALWSDSSLDIIWPCGHIFCYRSRDSGPGSTSQTLTYYFVPPQSTAPPLSSSINLTSNAPLMANHMIGSFGDLYSSYLRFQLVFRPCNCRDCVRPF